jgi:hypothetical protein
VKQASGAHRESDSESESPNSQQGSVMAWRSLMADDQAPTEPELLRSSTP